MQFVITNPGKGPVDGNEAHALAALARFLEDLAERDVAPVTFECTGDNAWDFQRLYVDGSSWLWPFALNMVESSLYKVGTCSRCGALFDQHERSIVCEGCETAHKDDVLARGGDGGVCGGQSRCRVATATISRPN